MTTLLCNLLYKHSFVGIVPHQCKVNNIGLGVVGVKALYSTPIKYTRNMEESAIDVCVKRGQQREMFLTLSSLWMPRKVNVWFVYLCGCVSNHECFLFLYYYQHNLLVAQNNWFDLISFFCWFDITEGDLTKVCMYNNVNYNQNDRYSMVLPHCPCKKKKILNINFVVVVVDVKYTLYNININVWLWLWYIFLPSLLRAILTPKNSPKKTRQ